MPLRSEIAGAMNYSSMVLYWDLFPWEQRRWNGELGSFNQTQGPPSLSRRLDPARSSKEEPRHFVQGGSVAT